MPRWVMSSPIHMSRTVPAVSEMTIMNTWGVSKFGMIGEPTPAEKLLNRKT